MIVINATITADEEKISAMAEAIVKMEKASLEEEGCQEYCWAVAIPAFAITNKVILDINFIGSNLVI